VKHRPAYNDIERIDKAITTILNSATKKVEGMKRNILYSQEKEVRRSELLYWKTLLHKNIGKTFNEDIMNRRKNITGILDKVKLDKEEILKKSKQLLQNGMK